MEKGNLSALLPIGVFLVLYLGLGILFEYILKIEMGFYNIPIVVCFLMAILVASLQNSKLDFNEKLRLMGKGIGDKNIITMILIFMTAGIFVGVVGRSSAESVAYFILSLIPAEFAVPAIFIISCFVSLSMGTSCGTITLIVPIAAAISAASGENLALCVATVMGGAMFGDNLSFISDTTIAVCNGQSCNLSDKFRTNFKLALPAALLSLVVITISSMGHSSSELILKDYSLLEIIPYILVLIGGIIGFNVFAILLVGIISGAIIMVSTGAVEITSLLSNMGAGAAGMFETSMVAILVAAMGALIKEYGGFDAMLYHLKNAFKSRSGGKIGIGLLVGAMDIATANNTVAIVMANPIARCISEEYSISNKETASLLDTWSCIFQGIIPYGAQMLIALAAVSTLGYSLSAFDIIPMLYYPFLLGAVSIIYIFCFDRKQTM